MSAVSAAPLVLVCGCSPTTTTADGRPRCVIHDCDEPAPVAPTLALRTARCRCFGQRRPWPKTGRCDAERQSAHDLPFFQYRPTDERDAFYCGCQGWD